MHKSDTNYIGTLYPTYLDDAEPDIIKRLAALGK